MGLNFLNGTRFFWSPETYQNGHTIKSMRNNCIVFALIVLGCNSNHQQSKQDLLSNSAVKCFAYPPAIDSLHLNNLYDSARWFIYTWHCDQSYLPKNDTLRSITFGELPLYFDNLNLSKDTLELNFYFIDNNQVILPGMTRDFKQLSTGVGFNFQRKQKLYMISPSGFSTIMKGGNNRYEQPMQSEVLAYIKNHWDRLDSCFKGLAIQHGISLQ